MQRKPVLVPLGVALAAMFPAGAQAKAAEVGHNIGRAQSALTQPLAGRVTGQPLLALPNGDSTPGYARHYSHHSHHSHRSHHSHYSSSGGGHYSHSSHSSHSSHYSSY